MHHIFVDFEMNHIAGEYQEERTFSKMEIVEIGAVMLESVSGNQQFPFLCTPGV